MCTLGIINHEGDHYPFLLLEYVYHDLGVTARAEHEHVTGHVHSL